MVISGPLKGTKFALLEGANTIGRSTQSALVLASAKVSKKHCTLLVQGERLLVLDENSSNGTFVNGELIRERLLTLGDHLSVGETVFEVGRINQLWRGPKRVEALPAVVSEVPESNLSPPRVEPAPKNLVGRLQFLYEKWVLPIFFSLSERYEWVDLLMGLVGVFLCGNLVLTVPPLLDLNSRIVVKEVGKRASFMARVMAEENTTVLAEGMETKVDIQKIEKASGIRIAMVLDLDGRILAPSSRMNQYLSSGPEGIFFATAKEAYRAGRETGMVKLSEAVTMAIEPIKVYQNSKNVVVALALVSVDVSAIMPEWGEVGVIYSETLILTALLALFCFYSLYRLTIRPLGVVEKELDLALTGQQSSVAIPGKHQEWRAVLDLLNAMIQRLPQGQMNAQPSMSQPWFEEVASVVGMLGESVRGGLLGVSMDQRIFAMNPHFEEQSGMRSEASIGQEVVAVARDESFSRFVQDCLERSSYQMRLEEEYELSGINYSVSVTCFGVLGESPRAVVFLFQAKEEG
jgi:hypothetical protein